MGSFTHTVDLTQITPMIHFQWYEDGACLRASEVKPKLDTYVLAWLKKQNIQPENLPVNWYNKNDSNSIVALRYKMRFSANKVTVNDDETRIHPLFFGNQGLIKRDETATRDLKIERGVKQQVTLNNLKMTLVSLTTTKILVRLPQETECKECSMMDILKSLLPHFFMTHCFGTRSNKGFGSFEVKNASVPVNEMTKIILPQACESAFFIKYLCNTPHMEDMLDEIYCISTLMKGGINGKSSNSPYFKSQLHQAVPRIRYYTGSSSAGNYKSEKAFIKEKVFNEFEKTDYNSNVTHKTEEQAQKQEPAQYFFYRALLGLTDCYKFRAGSNMKASISVKACDANIIRFPSPLVFKPCRNGLLIMLNSIPNPIKETSFVFRNCSEKLTIPNEFNLHLFVEDCLHAWCCTPGHQGQDSWNGWANINDVMIPGRNTKYGTRLKNAKKLSKITGNGNEIKGSENA